MELSLPPALDAVARDGVVTLQHGQARALGLHTADISRWANSGYLRKLGHGAYALTVTNITDAWSAHAEAHRRSLKAVCDGLPESYAVGPSAALCHGLPVLEIPNQLMLSRLKPLRTRRRIIHVRPAWPSEVRLLPMGVRAQSPASAVVETAAVEGAKAGLVVANAALHGGLDPQALEEAVWHYGPREGCVQVESMMRLADARVETALESVTLWTCAIQGIELEPQHVVTTHNGEWVARADFKVKGTNVLIEADGMGKYQSPETLRKEKRRELDIAACGYVVIRVTWDDLRHPDRFIARLREAVATSMAA